MEGLRAYETFDIQLKPSQVVPSETYLAIGSTVPLDLCKILERNGLEVKTISTEHSRQGNPISAYIRVHGSPGVISKFKNFPDVWYIEKTSTKE